MNIEIRTAIVRILAVGAALGSPFSDCLAETISAAAEGAGICAFGATTIDVLPTGKTLLKVQLSEPVVVSVASKAEEWGFFQFPKITRRLDGAVLVWWQMAPDALTTEGLFGVEGGGAAISQDGGKTWQPLEVPPEDFDSLVLPSGDRIKVCTDIPPFKVGEYVMPTPVLDQTGLDPAVRVGSRDRFFRYTELPAPLQGFYFKRQRSGQAKWVREHARLEDPKAIRPSYGDVFPIEWAGYLRNAAAADGLAVVWMCSGWSLEANGRPDPMSGMSFYRSRDEGRSWQVLGRIPYQPDLRGDPWGAQREGFWEPAFEILADGTYVCVLRTDVDVRNGKRGPMYLSRSFDGGATWTKPKIITPFGVSPYLLQLRNGVVALSAGRPGVQLRFSTVAGIDTWTKPVEMLPYKSDRDSVSCGYTQMVATGRDRFLLVYSDFNFENKARERRKAIKVQEIIVTLN